MPKLQTANLGLTSVVIFDDGYFRVTAVILDDEDGLRWWLTTTSPDVVQGNIGTSRVRHTRTPTMFTILRASIEAFSNMYRTEYKKAQMLASEPEQTALLA